MELTDDRPEALGMERCVNAAVQVAQLGAVRSCVSARLRHDGQCAVGFSQHSTVTITSPRRSSTSSTTMSASPQHRVRQVKGEVASAHAPLEHGSSVRTQA